MQLPQLLLLLLSRHWLHVPLLIWVSAFDIVPPFEASGEEPPFKKERLRDFYAVLALPIRILEEVQGAWQHQTVFVKERLCLPA